MDVSKVSKAGKALKIEQLRSECKAKSVPVSKKEETMRIRIQGVDEQKELHGVLVKDLNEDLDSLLINFFKAKSREVVRY